VTDIEELLRAAKNHGQQSDQPEMEAGDLQEIVRFMWGQLSLKSKTLTLKHFDSMREWL